ncbi:PREDICTED: high affinity copper uptake protein 1-like [Priapulus caudatus]|uniref:Copper transport protein n=1 Tax=Priapulus caudatus TaxID=37621 RepID=A0ABM1F083_PRICU|nr:PREDICTED: high affinity copper uptake protein 1-like [Priapulus caudatus]
MFISHLQMSFHGGFSELIVFDIWRVDTMSGMIWSALAVFTLALIYEGLKIWQENLLMQAQKACVRYTAYARTSKDRTVYSETRSHGSCCSGRLFSVVHVLQTLLHLIQVICSYFLMLVVMTYNAWLCTGVVLGATLGFFVFGWKRKVIVDSSDICH